MPLARFEKMPGQKKEQILLAAAREFATHGYDKASLNRILEQAGISKGAAYYYFEDKADLIATVVRHFWLDFMEDPELVFDRLATEGFWDTLTDMYIHPFDHIEERPWLLGFGRAVWELPEEMRGSGHLGAVFAEAIEWVRDLIRRGQELGAMRDDLPEDLLVSLVLTLDSVHDRWLAEHWGDLNREEFESFSRIFVDFMKKALEKPSEQQAEGVEGGPAT